MIKSLSFESIFLKEFKKSIRAIRAIRAIN